MMHTKERLDIKWQYRRRQLHVTIKYILSYRVKVLLCLLSYSVPDLRGMDTLGRFSPIALERHLLRRLVCYSARKTFCKSDYSEMK